MYVSLRFATTQVPSSLQGIKTGKPPPSLIVSPGILIEQGRAILPFLFTPTVEAACEATRTSKAAAQASGDSEQHQDPTLLS